MDFHEQTVLVTDAGVGIGRACALQFARKGANVVIMDMNGETLAQTEREIRHFGKIDILVNNARLWRYFTPFAVSHGSVIPSENPDMDYFHPSELSYTGRTGTAREDADLILFLASSKAGYITGQSIQIDGCHKKL